MTKLISSSLFTIGTLSFYFNELKKDTGDSFAIKRRREANFSEEYSLGKSKAFLEIRVTSSKEINRYDMTFSLNKEKFLSLLYLKNKQDDNVYNFNEVSDTPSSFLLLFKSPLNSYDSACKIDSLEIVKTKIINDEIIYDTTISLIEVYLG